MGQHAAQGPAGRWRQSETHVWVRLTPRSAYFLISFPGQGWVPKTDLSPSLTTMTTFLEQSILISEGLEDVPSTASAFLVV